MIRRLLSTSILAIATIACTFTLARAQEPKLVETFNDWAVYTYKGKSGSVCYAVSQPKDSSPKNVNRDPVHFLITTRPADKVHGEINTIIGYPFKKGSTVTVDIDTSKFTLFTSGDGAWADSSSKDGEILTAMKRGAKMVVTGVSHRGTKTVDNYSLSGVTAAVEKAEGICK